MNLSELRPGQIGRVCKIDAALADRLYGFGLSEGCNVKCLFSSPPGDPKAYLIKGAAVALRAEDARRVHLM